MLTTLQTYPRTCCCNRLMAQHKPTPETAASAERALSTYNLCRLVAGSSSPGWLSVLTLFRDTGTEVPTWAGAAVVADPSLAASLMLPVFSRRAAMFTPRAAMRAVR